jgi:hypothetical protein
VTGDEFVQYQGTEVLDEGGRVGHPRDGLAAAKGW